MNQKTKIKNFERIIKDIQNSKLLIDNALLELKKLNGQRLKNQDVVDFFNKNRT